MESIQPRRDGSPRAPDHSCLAARPAGFYGLTDHAQGGLVVQPDGKLVAAGASFTGGSYDFALARYNADGSTGVGRPSFSD
jgi:hypothetical protein